MRKMSEKRIVTAALTGAMSPKAVNPNVPVTPEEIAEVIAPQFKETDLDTITTIVKRYYDQDTWKENLIFEKDSFELLQDILEDAGELNTRAEYEKLVETEYAQKACES